MVAKDNVVFRAGADGPVMKKKFIQVSYREFEKKLVGAADQSVACAPIPHYYELVTAENRCKLYLDIDMPWSTWSGLGLTDDDIAGFVSHVVYELITQRVEWLAACVPLWSHSSILCASVPGTKASYHVRVALGVYHNGLLIPYYFQGAREVKRLVLHLKRKVYQWAQDAKRDAIMEAVDLAPYGNPTQQVRTIYSCKVNKRNQLRPVYSLLLPIDPTRMPYDAVKASYVCWRLHVYPLAGMKIEIPESLPHSLSTQIGPCTQPKSIVEFRPAAGLPFYLPEDREDTYDMEGSYTEADSFGTIYTLYLSWLVSTHVQPSDSADKQAKDIDELFKDFPTVYIPGSGVH